MNYGGLDEEMSGDDNMNKNINLQDINSNNIQQAYQGNNEPNQQTNKKEKETVDKTNNATITELVSGATVSSITKIANCLKPYFDVELADVINRVKGAAIPFTQSFYRSAEKNPDIYGPFWIFTTIIFLITSVGNFAGYLNLKEGEKFKYNFNFLPVSCLFIFGIGFGVPLIIFLVGKFMFKIDFGYILNLCLYGYSFVILIPILFLCMIPSTTLETLLLLYYTIHSSAFLIYNMYNILIEKAPSAKIPLLCILGGFQVALFFGLKFYFFRAANVKIVIED